MADSFEISIEYRGEEKTLTGYLLLYGYSHQIKMVVDEMEIYFEPDEEGIYRVLKMPWQKQKDFEKMDRALLYAIQQKIIEVLK
jgi:hypothetical protein